ncbi:MAG: hypothetical protein COA38_19130 [Fluviicola sp.]|nr:MAG: hypothetical protein COA38_19130 [Fluviicola sp.]
MENMLVDIKNWIVPMEMEAICFTADDVVKEKVIPQAADFKKMPYRDSADMSFYNSGPNIGERLLRKPFESNGSLETGVHLHWSLPFVLTHAKVDEDAENPELSFPKAPNRWLVCRRIENDLKYWLVESDLLFEEQQKGTNVTIPVEEWKGNGKPYRHLGRVRELGDVTDDSGSIPRFDLTAVGYGEPTFSAIYTNCQGVFGMHDSLEGVTDHETIKGYTVIGWYHNSDSGTAFVDVNDLRLAVEKSALVEDDQDEDTVSEVKLENLLYQGTVLFKSDTDGDMQSSDLIAEEVKVGVGNTSAEAMSAITGADDVDGEHVLNLFGSNSYHVLNDQDGEREANKLIHKEGFSSINGGVIWEIKQEEGTDEDSFVVADDIERKLIALNTAQQEHDKLAQEIEHYRAQLFADWYKYLLARYLPNYAPEKIDLNAVMDFMDQQVESLKTKALNETALKNKVAQLKRDFKDSLNGTKLELNESEAPRFWQAQNPVIAIELKENLKEGSQQTAGSLKAREVDGTGTVELDKLEFIARPFTPQRKKIFSKLIRDFDSITPDTDFGEFKPNYASWTSNAFSPVLLDWKMMYHAIKKIEGDDQRDRTANYEANFFLKNYQLRAKEEDAVLRNDIPETIAEFYSGSIILTESAGRQHQQSLEEHFGNESGFTSPLVLSQAMSGFNDALLMAKEVLQVDVNDTMAANELSELFSNTEIRNAIGDYNDTSPMPFSYFSPIRCGALSIAGLRLIDTFGRIRELNATEVNWSKGILAKEKKKWLSQLELQSGDSNTAPKVPIRPRITQPARLLFRWLTDRAVNNSIGTLIKSPIQGWIVPNFLDRSLEIYNPEGEFLYTIRSNENGRKLIKVNEETSFDDSGDHSNLDTWVKHLLATRDRTYLNKFLSTINQSLQNINPAIRSQYQELASLIGRPLALTRASFELELHGALAINQSWDSFKIDIDKSTPDERDNSDLFRVEFPIRLGDVAQESDGLVGYFLESKNGKAVYTTFYSQSVENDGGGFARAKPEDLKLKIGSSFTLTMLVDPMAKVTATMGILPSKSIEIPSALFTNALHNMEVRFQMNPIMTFPNMLNSADSSSQGDDETPFYLPLPGNPELSSKWTWQKPNEEISQVEDSTPFEAVIPDYVEFTEGFLKLKL